MTFVYKNIKKIEWEISTLCNVRCPQCPRNDYGGKTIPNLPLVNVTLKDAQSMLPIDFVENLEEVYFCGTYGDPFMNKEVIEIARWLKEINSNLIVSAHTNGSLQNEKFWKDVSQWIDWIGFGIDGLEDTNHLYRIDANWDRIIKNASIFIENGGVAIWDFIIFQHNEHQIEDARNLSYKLGFKEFRLKYTGRFFNKKHEFMLKWPVKNKNGKVERFLELPSQDNQNMIYANAENVKTKFGNLQNYFAKTEVNCYAKKTNQIYISAEGYVFPCGWLHDRLYGLESESHYDKQLLKKMFESIGGKNNANLNHTKLIDIINGGWFALLNDSFTRTPRLERCGAICGKDLNFIGSQNTDVNRKDPSKIKTEKQTIINILPYKE